MQWRGEGESGVSLLVLMFDSSFLQKWGVATSISNRGTPSSPQPSESEQAGLGWGRGAGALVTLAGEREALAWRQSIGPRGNTKARRHLGKARVLGGDRGSVSLLMLPSQVERLLTSLLSMASAQWLLPTACGFSTCDSHCPLTPTECSGPDNRGLFR